MPLIKSIRGFIPQFGSNCFFAENATIVGDVIMGDDCTVWFNAVIRGDVHSIRMGNKVNVQDCAVIHCTFQKASTTIGDNVSIAHNAVIHGCTIKDNVLIGMGAIIMDNSVIESNTIIAAGSIVLENSVLEPDSIYAGSPAKKIKSISKELMVGEIQRIANNYLKYAGWYREESDR
ncbi:MAG: gamma carbonic anhydrase family protein [Bacteroidia bacterium]|nr:gamma carbonic anhydrase family protein [Bacteroidia bacterium]